MLFFSCISILIVFTGVSPEEVGVFGLRFPGLTLSILNNGLIILLAYNILSFFFYGLSDFLRFRHRLGAYASFRALELYDVMEGLSPDKEEHFADELKSVTGYKGSEIPLHRIKALLSVRVVIDLLFPLVFGVLSLVLFICLHVLG